MKRLVKKEIVLKNKYIEWDSMEWYESGIKQPNKFWIKSKMYKIQTIIFKGEDLLEKIFGKISFLYTDNDLNQLSANEGSKYGQPISDTPSSLRDCLCLHETNDISGFTNGQSLDEIFKKMPFLRSPFFLHDQGDGNGFIVWTMDDGRRGILGGSPWQEQGMLQQWYVDENLQMSKFEDLVLQVETKRVEQGNWWGEFAVTREVPVSSNLDLEKMKLTVKVKKIREYSEEVLSEREVVIGIEKNS